MSAATITASAAAICSAVRRSLGADGALRLDVDVVAHHLGLALERLGGHERVGHARRAGRDGDEPHVVSSSSVPRRSPEHLDVQRPPRPPRPDAGSSSVPTCEMATTEQAVASAAASASGCPRRRPAIVPATIASPAPTVLTTVTRAAGRQHRALVGGEDRPVTAERHDDVSMPPAPQVVGGGEQRGVVGQAPADAAPRARRGWA